MRTAVVAAAVAIVVVSNVDGERDFQDRLAATGGVELYSDAIDRFAWDVDRTAPGAGLHVPEWGLAMPLSYLSDTAFPVRMALDLVALRAEACGGKPQVVAFLGEGKEGTFDAVAAVTGQRLEDVRTWRQRDGKPVFQAARYGAGARCAPPSEADAPAGGAEPALEVEPAAIPACPLLGPAIVGRVAWRVPGRAGRDVTVSVVAPGAGESVLARGPARGAADTGPWLGAGYRFVLRDAETQRVLAETTVRGEPCPAP